MPGYKSKTHSKKNLKSSNKAKNGGRRRKQTMKKVRRGRKVMRGGAAGSWVLSTMNQDQQGQFNALLYKYFADKATGIFDTNTITKLETQDEVAKAIFDKMEALKLPKEKEDEAYASFEPFFPEK